MKNINVDIRYADGRIFQCPQPTVAEAKEIMRRLWVGNNVPEKTESFSITGIMVTRWNGSKTETLAHRGEAFTY